MLSRHVIKRWNMHGLQISTALPNATVNSAECGCCKRSKVISWEGWDGESDLTCGGVSGFRAALPPSPHWQESSFPAHELRALSPRLDIQMKEEASSSSFFFFFFSLSFCFSARWMKKAQRSPLQEDSHLCPLITSSFFISSLLLCFTYWSLYSISQQCWHFSSCRWCFSTGSTDFVFVISCDMLACDASWHFEVVSEVWLYHTCI